MGNASVAVLYFDVVQPMTLHIDKRFVELFRDNNEHKIGENGKFSVPSPPKTDCSHQSESQLYQESVSAHTHSCQTRSLLTAFSKFTDRVVESVTEHSFFSKHFQNRNALDVFYKEADHIRQIVLRLFLCFHSRANAPIQRKQGNRKNGYHCQSHAPIHAK